MSHSILLTGQEAGLLAVSGHLGTLKWLIEHGVSNYICLHREILNRLEFITAWL